MIQQPSRTAFLSTASSKPLIISTTIAALVYFVVITFIFPIGNKYLFALVIIGEIFHTWQALTYLYTVWDMDYRAKKDLSYTPTVDVFITVAGEPTDIVRETAIAARDMEYPNHKVYILNDGFVAKKENWQEIESMAKELGIGCFTRKIAGGAKAGNINNAVAHSTGMYIAVFDADHVPHANFLRKTIPYFTDKKLGFVQTPQYYKNAHLNRTTKGSWEQQELFFGPICRGKNRLNSATMCGTNMVISREALAEVGDMCTESIAEDFATGMFIHEKGWRSIYVPEVLAEGLAPEDFLSYNKQQFRWARGALDIIFRYNLLLRSGLTLPQKIQYLSSASFFLSGNIVLINILLPLIFLYTGLIPLQISTMFLAVVFIPYISLTLFNLSLTSNFQFTFSALSFAIGGFWIHIKALGAAITGQKSSFAITAKKALEGNFSTLVIPHALYIALIIGGLPFAIHREGISPSVINNFAWAIFSIGIFVPFMLAAVPNLNFRSLMTKISKFLKSEIAIALNVKKTIL